MPRSYNPRRALRQEEVPAGRLPLTKRAPVLNAIVILDNRDHVAALVLNREAARHALREQGGAG